MCYPLPNGERQARRIRQTYVAFGSNDNGVNGYSRWSRIIPVDEDVANGSICLCACHHDGRGDNQH